LPGYDYDTISDDALLHRMLVKHGTLETPEGLRYRALALPRSGRMSLASLIWIEKYVREGGWLIGPQPAGPPGLLDDAQKKQYAEIAARMWRGCKQSLIASYDAGRIYCAENAHAALHAFGVTPDFESSGEGQFDYVHRRTEDADIYFVRNTQDSPASAVLSFRVHGRAPQLWQMDTATITAAAVYRESQGRTDLPLSFPAYGSVFIVFENAPTVHPVRIERDGVEQFPSIIPGRCIFADDDGQLAATAPGRYRISRSDGATEQYIVSPKANPATLGSKWTLTFPPGWGAPDSLPLKTFSSWTESADPGVRYFSGTASYHGSVIMPSAPTNHQPQVWLDLGRVREIAKVRIDGVLVGTLWNPPFRIRIDHQLHPGSNSIEIDVANLWANRLIGDKQPGARQYASTNITEYKSDSPLLPSGLLTRPRLYTADELRQSSSLDTK
ncbi:MAG TPA: glycosyl hydrolase, partial [Terriglobales bacterium]|nr:glycosyl hydrolase [Terriglobales bacterium]